MMKNCVMPDRQIASCPVDELYETLKTEKEKAQLEKEVCHLYGRITGQVLTAPLIRREYEAF